MELENKEQPVAGVEDGDAVGMVTDAVGTVVGSGHQPSGDEVMPLNQDVVMGLDAED